MKQKRTAKKKSVRIKEIKKAAKAIFFAEGFKSTTMQKVAEKVKLSKGTIYLYFRNKEELYLSLMMPVLEELTRKLSDFEEAVVGKKDISFKQIINGFYQTFYQAYKYDPEGIRIIQAFQQGDHFAAMSKEMLGILNDHARRNLQISRRIISRLGITSELDAIRLVDTIWALFVGVVQFEESKKRATKKDHLQHTLEFSFSIIEDSTYFEKKMA